MFYYIYEWWAGLSDGLKDTLSPLRVLQYITVRAFCGAGTAFAVSVILGPWVIRQLSRLRIEQYVRKEEAPPLGELHGHKEGTPTMGGLLIVGAITFSALLWAVPTNPYVLLAIAALLYMALVGFWDDYLKVSHKRSKGLSARSKLVLQMLFAVALVSNLLSSDVGRENVLKLFG